jgi:RNA polymerase sigma-70 factor (ECF subfamily)
MPTSAETSTSPTLLGRLQRDSADQEAWRQFVQRYGPRIYHWCRRWQLQEADAQDVTQNVLLKLVAKLRHFRYDPARSFRGWLKTVTHHALSDFLEEGRREGASCLRTLDEAAAQASLIQCLEEEFDQELLEEAMAQVQLRIAPHKWEAFRLTALEGLSGKEAAARLKMKVATVFTAKSKVQKLLQEEIQRLDGPGGE